ncbi:MULTISPECIES: hypothetical protein [Flavobacteriaceae]|uniref:Uncharacterized protein n=1 Tax=Pseudozobellia thermophila TaxID=192903 RepID=A0A1M6EBU4_9FLAO|nr:MULTISPECIES: hypothetical protein [Flavobacteriaceae]MDO6516739.1 hypothetical protein [Zobellia uliginosa]SHI82770.1 hypothetical protein SAMN04488513_1023 [Pseudozobellia thermophila]
MKNQSSLNDVFRFVELKPSNILKAYPLIETDKIASARLKSKSEKISIAKKFLGGLKDLNSGLNYGREMKSELDTGIEYEETTVEQLYSAFMSSAGTDVGLDDYVSDLELLSELIYFSHYDDFRNLSMDNLNLYLAYQILLKAKENDKLRAKKLSKVLGLESTDTPFIKNVGVADLLVVKQHLLRYEETEIAHIENVMIGETRSREHRHLDRFEETLLYENEKSVQTEKESETAERFEMNRETANTIQEDQKFSADLSISGKWGPVVNFSNNLAFSSQVSETNEVNTSSEYAKDIMDRSLEKVNERVRTERVTKIIKENETKDLHSFTNVAVEGSPPIEPKQISGIYQFVDKIYKAQVFNYGQRQMFDLMIPEPASYLHHLNVNDSEISNHGLVAPPKFNISPFDIDYEEREDRQGVNPATRNPITFRGRSNNYYAQFVKKYGATGVKPPPSEKIVTFSVERPEAEASESGSSVREFVNEHEGGIDEAGWYFYPPSVFEIDIPKKYNPTEIDMNISALSDNTDIEELEFFLNFGSEKDEKYTLKDHHFALKIGGDRGSRHLYSYTGNINLEEDNRSLLKRSLEDNNKFKMSYFSQDSGNHTITFHITCKPSDELIKEWQLETYDFIQTAYQDRLMEYESKLAQFNADRKAQDNFEKNNYGVPPSKQKQVMLTELKKHAISIFTNNFEKGPNFMAESPVTSGTKEKPPKIDRQKAKIHGDHIRFFENAFEWSQMQYALYPYFWSDYDKWEDKFKTDDTNYEYQQFLQASVARLVLPVRLKFEEAVAHYLETGEPWNGKGTPEINDPLYVSIITEIKEKSGVTDKEPIPEGEPWEVRLPTSLIKLKQDDSLPEWEESPEGSWDWNPV